MCANICPLNSKKDIDSLSEKIDKMNFIFNTINSTTSDYIVVLDDMKKIISYSDNFLKLVKEDYILGQSFIKIAEKTIELPNDFFKEKRYFIKKKNTMPQKVFLANIEKYEKKFNTNDRYFIILKDISHEIDIQAQKDNFVATLTHDLKTPVRADIVSLELLLKGHFGELLPQQAEILEEMLNSNKFMMNMIDTLLAKYKYENNRVELSKSDFELNNFIKNITNELRCLFEEKNISCEFFFEVEKINIHADKIELKRAISNLLSNAIKFNHENGFVKIYTITDGDFVKIKIKDSGIGMNHEKLQHIFDKYVSYAKRFRQLGTGLGLYVAKKIIETHNGDINVTSKPNNGSTFTITLPLCTQVL